VASPPRVAVETGMACGPAVLRDLERTEDPKLHHVIAPFDATVPAFR